MEELRRLEIYLRATGVQYEAFNEEGIWGRHQIIVFEDGERSWDAICQRGSYGWEDGLLEVMGEPVVKPEDGDSVCGWLTADEVIERFEEYKDNGRRWL